MKQRFYFRSFATGGSSPDPAIYCPANGYIPDPEILHPPIPLPETTPESIICICNAAIGGWKAATHKYRLFKGSGTAFRYTIYDNTGTEIDTFTDNTQYIDFDFPDSIGYYTVKITIEGTGGYFTGFYNNDSFTILYDDCVEAIILNTPTNGIQFTRRYSKNFKNLEFANAATFEKSTDLSYMVIRCDNFNYFKFPEADYSLLNALFSMMQSFAYSAIRKLDLSKFNDATGLYLTDSLCKDCKYLDEFIFPSNWSGRRLSNMFQNTTRLRKLLLPDTWITSTGTHDSSMTYFIANSAVEGELVFEQITGVTTFSDFANICPNLEILRFKGTYSLISSGTQRIINQCPSLRIFEMPRSIGTTVISGFPFDTSSVKLEQYIGPDIGYCGMPTANSPLTSITGEHDTSGLSTLPAVVTIPTGALVRAALSTLQMAKLRTQRFVCGTSAATKFTVLNTLEIDWANSSWASATSPQLSISAALSATEINRILTALPTVTGKTADFRYCDGYATCDKTIATAKGWTML